MKRKDRESGLLGFHGLVFSSPDPTALARRWEELTGLRPLRRSRREVVLGGPELFVVVRRARPGSPESLDEVHLAVDELAATGRRGEPDALGGDSWSRRAGASVLVVRQFRRPPGRKWVRRRHPV